MSHTSLTYHIVFSTYRRMKVIDILHERELYKYIYDFSKNRGIFIRRIGGMPDHIHILCDIPAKIAVAEYVKLLKVETSKFLRVNPHFPQWVKWSEGYGAFTVDASLRETRVAYIMNQKSHHKCVNFDNEYNDMLVEAGIDAISDVCDT
ncbi:MAG: IS200/IS605 family transposase [Duncaniella sp.]|nr:IS200/IS605 family transposase [Duncaniella sp.]